MCHMLTDKIVSRQSTICAIHTNKCHATLPMYATTYEQHRQDVCQQQLQFRLSYCHSKNTRKNKGNRKPQNTKRPLTAKETAGNKTFHCLFATFRRYFTAQKAAFGMAKDGLRPSQRPSFASQSGTFHTAYRHQRLHIMTGTTRKQMAVNALRLHTFPRVFSTQTRLFSKQRILRASTGITMKAHTPVSFTNVNGILYVRHRQTKSPWHGKLTKPCLVLLPEKI